MSDLLARSRLWRQYMVFGLRVEYRSSLGPDSVTATASKSSNLAVCSALRLHVCKDATNQGSGRAGGWARVAELAA